MSRNSVELVRRGYEAAASGDLETIAAMLAPDVTWHGAGDDEGGCRNRQQALHWMRQALDRGVRVELLEARELPGDRVLLVLQRQSVEESEEPGEARAPHGQILTFRDGRIADMTVYPTAEEAIGAAGPS